jgi:hypothetical protein
MVGANVKQSERGLGSNHFFLVGVLVGSACGLILGSALGFELRPDRIRALKRFLRRVAGQEEERPRFELLV